MVLETPSLSNEIKKNLNSKNCRDRPIKTNYPGFEACFVMFHPFLKIKEGHEFKIHFEADNNKQQVIEHYDKLSWTSFLKLSGIRDYKSLDRALAFYHRAFRIGERNEFLKLKKMIEINRVDIIPPQVDKFPEILENEILMYLKKIGYKKLYFYSDIIKKNELKSIDEQLNSSERLIAHVRIETPDNEILVAQDFDQRFSYLFGNKTFIQEIVTELDLEGFYCDNETPESWSYEIISEKETITW